MSALKKLQKLLGKNNDSQDSQNDTKFSQDTAHLSPISMRVSEWMDERGWSYDHHTPSDYDEMRTHYFVTGFRDDTFTWTCIIKIYEKNQLMSFQGLLQDPIASAYYLSVLVNFAKLNSNVGIGSFELDTDSGIARTKIGVDGEFTRLSDHALNCYIQGIASLTERMHLTIQALLEEPPIGDLAALLKHDDDSGDDDEYFLANGDLQ